MLSNTNDFHGPVGPCNDTAFFQEVDSQFGGLLDMCIKTDREVDEVEELKNENLKKEIIEYAKKIRVIQSFPLRAEVQFKFVDYDNTLSHDKRRFQVCKELEDNRGKLAYPIIKKYFGRKGSNGKREYVRVLKYHEFYDPNNPYHVILTAGDEELQRLKIKNSGLGDPKFIIVDDADKKIRAIIDFILKLGYIPGKIQFIDDKIREFNGIDQRLSKLLGIEVDFFQAIPQEDKSVKLINITRSVQAGVNGILANAIDMKNPMTANIRNPMTAKNDRSEILSA
ncbi:hypothetical protein K2X92_05020 [Candidatus Gracilibacteria bacterium]|nr:hypothetical protein [Candidatus Gracilibacteria bacterium]